MVRKLAVAVVVIALVGCAVALGWDATHPTHRAVMPPAPTKLLVGMGDSYASGEGLAPYELGTDTSADQCHRSQADAYVVRAAQTLDYKVHDVACSGATTATVMTGMHGEPNQIDAAKGADAITITIGGNDIQALGYIIQPPAQATIDASVASLEPKLVSLFQQVKRAAPSARIVAVGYPSIVPQQEVPGCNFSEPQLQVLNTGATQLNAAIAEAADTAGIRSVDATNAFRGHELCTDDPWINGLDLSNIVGSLHPNSAGQAALAQIAAQGVRAP